MNKSLEINKSRKVLIISLIVGAIILLLGVIIGIAIYKHKSNNKRKPSYEVGSFDGEFCSNQR